jgi:hypothetical protein
VGLPPDFLLSMVALAHLMRLSSQKAARVVVGECYVAGNPGRPVFFGPGTPMRSWSTRPITSNVVGLSNCVRQTFDSIPRTFSVPRFSADC